MDSLKVRKFSGRLEDYKQWRRELMAVLTLKDLGYLFKTGTLPVGANATKKEEIIEDNEKAYAYIYLSVDPKTALQLDIEAQNNGFDSLKFLDKKYGQTSLLHMANLRTSMANMRLEEGGDIDEYLLKIREKARQINDSEPDSFSPIAIASTILGGLPDSYQSWVYAKGVGKPNLDEIEKELRVIAAFQREKDVQLGSSSNPIVLNTQNVGKKFQKSKGKEILSNNLQAC